MNFTDQRMQVNVTANGVLIPNNSLNVLPQSSWGTGDNVIYNDTETREIHVVFNGKDSSRKNVWMDAARCIGECLTQINNTPIENTTRRWSDPSSWTTTGKVPVFNDNITVESGWNMIYDLKDSPILNYLEINGRLTFEDDIDGRILRSNYIFVRAGELIIGD